MNDQIYEIDDFDVANVTAKYNEIEEQGPELKISKGTVILHFIRKSIRYKGNKSYKKTNEDAEISKEPVDQFPNFETFHAPLRSGYLYISISHKKNADTDYFEFQVTEVGTLILRSKSKGQIWTEEERGTQNTHVPYLTLDNKSFVYAAYSEVRWTTKYAEDQFFDPTKCFQHFDTHKWIRGETADFCIKGEQYQSSYYLYNPTKIAFDRAYKSYLANKDDWHYEEDAFMVLEDALGQISDLCYEILHANLSITAAMMAPLLSSTADELLGNIVNGTLNQAIDQSPEIDPTSISVEQTNLEAREKARKAIYDAKKMILSQINNSSRTERANIELTHYLKNNLLSGKFRVLQISRFLLTPADLVDFMIKDEQSDPDPGIQFVEEFFETEGYSSSLYYAILTQYIDIHLYKLSKTHYAYWKEVIDLFGTIAIYKDIFYNQKRFMDILTSVNLFHAGVSCTKSAFYKIKEGYHIEDYVLDMPEQELKALEKEHKGILPKSRRIIYPATEFTKLDYSVKLFEVNTIAFDYRGLETMDYLNGLRNDSRELYELINQVNQKAVAWVIEEKMSDKNTQSRTTMFSNLDDYVQHILKRSFGITGNNPNGFVFQDPKGSEELVYTGIVCKAASDKLNPLPYYKVFAMSHERIRNMGCAIYEYQMTDAVSKFVRFNKYGYYHSVSSSTGSAPEPFQFDGTINLDYTDSNNSRGNLMLRSNHVSDDEKSQIITRSIHKAQKDFINHPVTKGAIFILTSVITAGMMQGVSAGSRMLFRNAFRKVLANSSELTAKTIGAKAVVSIGYQTITQEGKVNLVTVLGDSFFSPYAGQALGNVFTINLDIFDFEIKYEWLFSNKAESRDYIASAAKTLIMGTVAKYCPIGYSNNKISIELVANFIYNSNFNAFSEGVSKAITNENK